LLHFCYLESQPQLCARSTDALAIVSLLNRFNVKIYEVRIYLWVKKWFSAP